MTTSQLTATIKRYEAAIETLQQSKPNLLPEDVLALLNVRDTLQIVLKEEKYPPTSRLNRIIELDGILRTQAEAIIQAITPEKLAQWRESVKPAPEAWWWKLETFMPLHPRDRFDGLWKLLTLASWTFNISLLADLAKRFFSGGVGFIGAVAVTLPGLMALLQASSELTKAGKNSIDNILTKLQVPPHWRQEAKLAITLAVSGLIAALWFSLPIFSDYFAHSGLNNYQKGNLGSAEQDLQKAISLNPDNSEAHLYLGNIYEDYQEFERAQKQYQLALGGDLPGAYNNLARIHIRNKKYPEAANLADQGLNFAGETDIEIRYNLLKNQGWARLKEERYEEAEELLQAAIDIANAPETGEYIDNPGSSHCLLAETLEQQESSIAIQQWQKCCKLGQRKNIDEDILLHLARKNLEKAGKSCTL